MDESKGNLTVLDGGRTLPVSEMRRLFLDAYVTDTRLMGVLAVCARWTIAAPFADRNAPDSWEDLRQFFYIDCEESGLETYQQVRGENDPEAARIEEALVCGLGGRKIDLNERQLRLLLQTWAGFNRTHDLPLPAGHKQYGFLLDPKVPAAPEEETDLMKMICPPIQSDEQAINYFLMRCFGQDAEGARYLTAGADVPVDLFFDFERATFCRNAIEPAGSSPEGAAVYRCESLIEMNGLYTIVISLLTVRNLRIAAVQRCGSLPVSQAEAALILKKTEYVSLYEVFLSEEELEDNIDEFTLGFHATMSEYENGRLFMTFRPTNDHVDSRLFLLSNDVRGLYFLTNHSQLVLCAYRLEDLYYLERTIASSVLAPYLSPGGHFNFVPGSARRPRGTITFREPVLYEFMCSDFERFEDFLAALQGED